MSQVQIISMTKISLLFIVFVSICAGSGHFVQGQEAKLEVALGGSGNLSCHLDGSNLKNSTWLNTTVGDNTSRFSKFETFVGKNDSTGVTMIVKFENVTREDNGLYACWGTDGNRNITNTSRLIVREKPEVQKLVAKAVMLDKLYLSWEIYDGHSPVLKYSFWHEGNDSTNGPSRFDDPEKGSYSNYVLNSQKELQNGKTYKIGIIATNALGDSPLFYSTDSVTPLTKDFVPKPVAKEATNDSITIAWTEPDAHLQDYYNYTVEWTMKEGNSSNTTSIARSNTLTVKPLQPETDYRFKVRTCVVDHPDVCGNWSSVVEGHTEATKNGTSGSSASSHASVINVVAIATLSLCSLIN